MPQTSWTSIERAAEPRHRSVVAGVVAGIIALGCCVGPAVAALVGITSATVAVDLATDLYGTWGWLFKLAGVVFGAAAVLITVRRRRACGAKPRVWRSVGVVAVVGVATYSLLYAGTTWLGVRASEPPPPPKISVEGASVAQRAASALSQVRDHYPHFLVQLEGVSSEGVSFTVGWSIPDLPPLSDEYQEEIVRRVEDSREATVVLLRALARSDPDLRRFSAHDDRFFIPIWSRAQILRADPTKLRDFSEYTRFQFSAHDRGGYAAVFGDEGWK